MSIFKCASKRDFNDFLTIICFHLTNPFWTHSVPDSNPISRWKGAAKTGTYRQMTTLQRAHIVTWKIGSTCVPINVILEKKKNEMFSKKLKQDERREGNWDKDYLWGNAVVSVWNLLHSLAGVSIQSLADGLIQEVYHLGQNWGIVATPHLLFSVT